MEKAQRNRAANGLAPKGLEVSKRVGESNSKVKNFKQSEKVWQLEREFIKL